MEVGVNHSVGRGPRVDLTFVVPVAPLVFGVGVGIEYYRGQVPSGLGAVSLLATLLAAVVLLFTILEAFGVGKLLFVDFDRDDIKEHVRWLLGPAVPVGALLLGLAFGYFFW